MKRLCLIIFCGLALPIAVQGVSFDCGKASTDVEKQVCGNPSISQLDDELGKLYQEAMNKADEKQKQRLVVEQKHWLKYTRNLCKDEPCLKLAYWSRQAEVASFFKPKPPLYKHEGDKADAIKQVLATERFDLQDNLDKRFCGQLFDDLKQMKDIRFVDPVVQTQSYEDPALDKWKRHCGTKPPLHFSYGCIRGGLQNVLDTIHDYTDALEAPGCFTGFGIPPIKLYELPPLKHRGEKRHIFYADGAYGSAGGGFQQIDPEKCDHVIGVSFMGGTESHHGNYNNIIEYKSQYYFLGLQQQYFSGSDGSASLLILDVETVAPNGFRSKKKCSWRSPLKTDSSTQGSK